ncbi:hypothetical protein OXYTRIMIC_503 [Oxytricha trifallax]|uniref:Uncharacterized protein n=1 Tax=Oxytricha trifallax TaxID=1172189 RepID=A0A073IBD5_9SPIT|nr:hypothetical protein OXYTRIMIC_503 [Oxytricha trifallax]
MQQQNFQTIAQNLNKTTTKTSMQLSQQELNEEKKSSIGRVTKQNKPHFQKQSLKDIGQYKELIRHVFTVQKEMVDMTMAQRRDYLCKVLKVNEKSSAELKEAVQGIIANIAYVDEIKQDSFITGQAQIMEYLVYSQQVRSDDFEANTKGEDYKVIADKLETLRYQIIDNLSKRIAKRRNVERDQLLVNLEFKNISEEFEGVDKDESSFQKDNDLSEKQNNDKLKEYQQTHKRWEDQKELKEKQVTKKQLREGIQKIIERINVKKDGKKLTSLKQYV